MKYIITSGPMEMNIDDVRKIQNSSTGSLGCAIADQINQALEVEITYIHTAKAKVPTNVKLIEISNHQQLLTALKAEMTDECCVIHAMAISDFKTAGSLSKSELLELIVSNRDKFSDTYSLEKLITSNLKQQSKLSSKDDQILFFEKEIKVIDQIKKINPKAILIGFKLLSDVSYEQLIDVATSVLKRANCDYVVANLKEEVSETAHHALIIGKDSKAEAFTKQQIAKIIIDKVEKLWEFY